MNYRSSLILLVVIAAACTRQDGKGARADSTAVPGTPSDTVVVQPAAKDDLLRLSTPLPGQVVTSPLLVAGEARGPWFFEASFPVYLLDANGDTLVVKPAQAEGEWMTENYVPFKVVLEFTAPASATGTLLLKKDNASGLPEHDNELRVPIRFH